ncbi:MAG: translation initiation factor IF-3 [Thermodesulfobacteriota bacterium]
MAKNLRTRINKDIRGSKLRVIDDDGTQLGVMSSDEAYSKAQEEGLDLVEIAPTAAPPVCKIMDYGKYKYILSKKAHQAKKKQSIIHMKEIKLRPRTDKHDIEFKVKHIRKFLEEGNKVKILIFFRGREIQHPYLGEEILNKVAAEVEDVGVVEQKPRLEGRKMSMVICKANT